MLGPRRGQQLDWYSFCVREEASQYRYQEIASALRQALRRSPPKSGKLPAERALCRQFGAQRNTVRQALEVLNDEGLIRSVGKSGWYLVSGSERGPSAQLKGSRIVLVTVGRSSGANLTQLREGVQEAIRPHGAEVIHYDVPHSSLTETSAPLDQLEALNPIGLIVWPDTGCSSQFLLQVRRRHPVVFVDRRAFGLETDSVAFDDREAGRAITSHLIGRGHKVIGFMGDEPFAESVLLRWQGMRAALYEAGLPFYWEFSAFTNGSGDPMFSSCARILLEGHAKKPTAIVCSNDTVASSLILSLRGMGLMVPEDVAVTGFGNDLVQHLDVIGLTTMSHSFHDLGFKAAKMLLHDISTPREPFDFERAHVRLPMSLVVRSSCALPSV